MRIFCGSLLMLGCTVGYAAAPPLLATAQETQSLSPPVTRASRSDSVLITGELDQLTRRDPGGGGSIDWIHSNTQGRSFSAGIASYSLIDSRWTFGRVGATFRPLERTIAHAQVSLGSGQTLDSGFVYRVFEGDVTWHAFTRVYMRLGDQYLHIGDARGNLLKPGAVFLLMPRLSLDLTYARSMGGNFGTEFASGRFDFAARPLRLLGGFALGRSTPEVFNLAVATPALDRHLKETFVGFALPLSRSEFSTIFDLLNFDSVHRRTLTLSLRVPLGKQAR